MQGGGVEVFHARLVIAALFETAALHGFKLPRAVGPKLARCCAGLRGKATSGVKFENAHVEHAAVGGQRAHVDRIGAVFLPLFEPGPRGAGGQTA
ncbi:hypothetical protein D3C72_1925250 [compost metagenome]